MTPYIELFIRFLLSVAIIVIIYKILYTRIINIIAKKALKESGLMDQSIEEIIKIKTELIKKNLDMKDMVNGPKK